MRNSHTWLPMLYCLLLNEKYSLAGFGVRLPKPTLYHLPVDSSQRGKTFGRRKDQYALSMSDSPTPGSQPEESQSAFQAMLELSSMLKSYGSNTQDGSHSQDSSAISLSQTTSSAQEGDDDVYYQPAIQLSIGASKAFRAIDRNLMRTIEELGQLDESLRSLASEQSDFIARYLEMPENQAPESKEAVIAQSVATVRELASIDQRLNKALSDLYAVSSFFHIVESNNSDLTSKLAGKATVPKEEIQGQAISTSKAFDEIDDKLSKALTEVRALGSSFKTLEAKAQRSRQLQPSKTTDAGQVQQQNYAPFSPLPVPSGTDMLTPEREHPAPKPIDVTNTFESALQLSIAAANAFNNGNVVMTKNDDKILGVLRDLQGSLGQLTTQASINVLEKATTATHPPSQATPMVTPPPEQHTSPVESTSTSASALLPPCEELNWDGKDTRLETAMELSRAAAQAFETMNMRMSKNDNEALSVLRDLSISFKTLASSDHAWITRIAAESSNETPASSSFTGTFESAPSALSSASAETPGTTTNAASQIASPASQENSDQGWEHAFQLATAAARAFSDISRSMTRNDDIILAELQGLRSTFRTLAEKDGGLSFLTKRQPRSSEAGQKSAITSPQIRPETDAVPKSVQISETVSTSFSEQNENMAYKRAMSLSASAALAFSEMDEVMSKNEAAAMVILDEINASFRKLARSEIVLSPMYHGTESQPAALDQHQPSSQLELAHVDSASSPAFTERSDAVSQQQLHDKDAEEKAYKLSIEAAKAFNRMESIAGSNSDQMMAILQEIKKSFAKMVKLEADFSDLIGENTSVVAEDITPVTSWKTAADTQAIPQSQADCTGQHRPTAGKDREEQDFISRDKAMMLSLEAAYAFNEIDRNMVKNDAEALSLLNGIKESFDKLAALDDGSTTLQWPKLAPVSPPAPLVTPNPSQSSTFVSPSTSSDPDYIKEHVSSPPQQHFISSLETKRNLNPVPADSTPAVTETTTEKGRSEQARSLSSRAAQAIDEMDESMSRNDEEIIREYRAMNAYFKKLASHSRLHAMPTSSNEPMKRVQPTLENVSSSGGPIEGGFASKVQLSTKAGREHSQPKEGTRDDTAYPAPEAQKLSYEQAIFLSKRAAGAFDCMGDNMVKNDEAALDILREIRGSFRQLVELEDGSAVVPTEPPSTKVLPMIETKPDRDTSASSTAPSPSQEEIKVATKLSPVGRETVAIQAALQLSRDAAMALEEMTHAMDGNDELTLAVLREIRSSFQKLADSGNGLPHKTENNSRASAYTHEAVSIGHAFQTQSPATSVGISTDKDRTSMPEVVTPEEQKAIREKAVELSKNAASALDGLSSSMSRNDEVALDVLREISASFRKLSSSETGPSGGNVSYKQMDLDVEAGSTVSYMDLNSPSTNPQIYQMTTPAKTPSPNSAPMRDNLAWERALELSKEAARLFEGVNDEMLKSDGKVYSVLTDIKETLSRIETGRDRRLKDIPSVSNEHLQQALPAPSMPIRSESGYSATSAESPPTAAKPNESVASTPVSSPPLAIHAEDEYTFRVSTMERARQLSVASANALDEATRTMSLNDEILLLELQSLSDSFKTLASHENAFDSLFRKKGGYDLREPHSSATQENYHHIEGNNLQLPNSQAQRVTTTRSAGLSDVPKPQQDGSVTRVRVNSSSLEQLATPAATAVLPKQETPAPNLAYEEGTPELVWSLSSPPAEIVRSENEQRVLPAYQLGPSRESVQPTIQQRTQATVHVIEDIGGKLVNSLERRLSLLSELNDGFKQLADRY